jgi:hypothetical protein
VDEENLIDHSHESNNLKNKTFLKLMK